MLSLSDVLALYNIVYCGLILLAFPVLPISRSCGICGRGTRSSWLVIQRFVFAIAPSLVSPHSWYCSLCGCGILRGVTDRLSVGGGVG